MCPTIKSSGTPYFLDSVLISGINLAKFRVSYLSLAFPWRPSAKALPKSDLEVRSETLPDIRAERMLMTSFSTPTCLLRVFS